MSAFEILYQAACDQSGKGDSNQVVTEVEHPGAGHQVLRTGALLTISAKQVQDKVAGFHYITDISLIATIV